MRKKLIGIVVATAIGFLSLHSLAWADDGETWQEKLDGWFAGIGKEMDRVGESFAKTFSTWPDSDR